MECNLSSKVSTPNVHKFDGQPPTVQILVQELSKKTQFTHQKLHACPSLKKTTEPTKRDSEKCCFPISPRHSLSTLLLSHGLLYRFFALLFPSSESKPLKSFALSAYTLQWTLSRAPPLSSSVKISRIRSLHMIVIAVN